MKKKILLVDDEMEIIEIYTDVLKAKNYDLESAANRQEALDKIRSFKPDLITLDMEFGHDQLSEGVNILKEIRKHWNSNELPILIVTGKGSSDDFVEAKLSGANGVVLKSRIEKVMEKIEEILRQDEIGEKRPEKPIPDKMRGKGTREITVQLFECAERDCNVLILGETGTGKNLAAEIYRQASPRKDKFYRIDCAALPENLMQSELFGVESGGYTDAKPRKGKLEEADGGIVFFDEIGDLTPGQQKVLLDFWDTKEITRLGSNRKTKLDVVILAATNQDLEQLTGENKFRPDLFRRLWKHIVRMPPLRETKEDIPVLVDGFIGKFNQQYQKNVQRVDEEIMDLFQRLDWQGNVGELRNYMESGMLNCSGTVVKLDDIKNLIRRDKAETSTLSENAALKYHDLQQKQDDEKRKLIFETLEKCGGNQSQAARILGISRERFIQLLKKYSKAS